MGNLIANRAEIINQRTLKDLYSDFLNFIDVCDKSTETYNRALRQFNNYTVARNITHPTRTDIINYREHLKATGKSANTIQNYIIAVRQFFKWAAQNGAYENIAVNIKGAKVNQEHKKDALTEEQARRILKSIDTTRDKGARDYAIIVLMIVGGLRTVEITRADINDIQQREGHTVLYIQGKGRDSKDQYIKIPSGAAAALEAYISKRGTQGGQLFLSTSNNNKGARLTTRSISGIVKERMKAAGYNSDRLTAHSLRHTAATLNLLHGGTLEETQQLLRHSKLNTTMIYLHHLDRLKNCSEERIAEAIF